jgi:hypothetical protein
MSIDIESTATEIDAQADTPPDRTRTAVWRHERREAIEHLLRTGRSAHWIAAWLEHEYPLYTTLESGEDGDDDDEPRKVPHPEMARHRRLQLSEDAIEKYRADWLPECVPGVDAVSDELLALIGRKFPAGARWELEVMEAGVHAFQHMLEAGLRADIGLNLGPQPTTLDAGKDMITAAERLIAVKGKLGIEGYEVVPERTENVNRNLNANFDVDLTGKINRDGTVTPGNPDAVALMSRILNLPPGEREQVVETHRALTAPDDDQT